MGTRRTRADKHVEQTPTGPRAHIRINGVLYRRRFRRDADPVKIREWLLSVETRHRSGSTRASGAFDDDARAYLEAVKAMPSYAERKQYIEEWIEVFGHRQRHSISSAEIAAQLNRWRSEPREVNFVRRGNTGNTSTKLVTLSASSVNHRRTAIHHMYRTLDGRAAFNPVRDIPKFREPAPLPKAIPYDLIRQIFDVMGDTTACARLKVIAYIGLPHAQIYQIKPEHVDFKAKTLIVHGRRKGHGTAARVVPLSKDGVAALRAMERHDAWGWFARSGLHKAFRLACKQVPALKDVSGLTPYDLRHSFGSEVYRKSGDIRATQVLMGHSTERLTHRYTLAAVDQRLVEALKKFGQRE